MTQKVALPFPPQLVPEEGMQYAIHVTPAHPSATESPVGGLAEQPDHFGVIP